MHILTLSQLLGGSQPTPSNKTSQTGKHVVRPSTNFLDDGLGPADIIPGGGEQAQPLAVRFLIVPRRYTHCGALSSVFSIAAITAEPGDIRTTASRKPAIHRLTGFCRIPPAYRTFTGGRWYPEPMPAAAPNAEDRHNACRLPRWWSPHHLHMCNSLFLGDGFSSIHSSRTHAIGSGLHVHPRLLQSRLLPTRHRSSKSSFQRDGRSLEDTSEFHPQRLRPEKSMLFHRQTAMLHAFILRQGFSASMLLCLPFRHFDNHPR